MNARLVSMLLVCLAGIAGCGGPSADGSRSAIPDRTVVLTFDDAVRNHLTYVAPHLLAYGFGATFFVTERWMDGGEKYCTWPEVAELERLGFEIGNHTSQHMDLSQPGLERPLKVDMDRMHRRFREHGIAAPVSFAWPGCGFGPESLEVLGSHPYAFARRGMKPELSRFEQTGLGPTYDPSINHPLLIPSAEVWSQWTLERFVDTIEQAHDGRAVVLQFHGIPDPGNPMVGLTKARFLEFMEALREHECNVIAMRDLRQWVDPTASVDDPMLRRSWPGERGRE